MRSRRTSAEHQEAVTRRLALLSAELSAVRPQDAYEEWADPAADGTPWWDGHTRVSAGRAGSRQAALHAVAEAPPAQLDPPEPTPVPDPGRHAARRRRRAAWPEAVRGRLLLEPAQLTVVAVVVAAGLAVTCWWVVRGDADPASDITQAPSRALVSLPSGDALPGAAAGAPTSVPTTVTVDVAGKVRRPGIAVLDAGARVVDALEAAGGTRPGADLTGLNLARVLVDGEQVVVGLPAPTGAAAAAVPSAGAPSGPLVNLNTATETELDTLPEVGPVTAQSILAWRDEHGGFTAVDELLEVDGIGDATLERIAPFVTV
jgi:competence protein ComEA